jgi:hypothetical protein
MRSQNSSIFGLRRVPEAPLAAMRAAASVEHKVQPSVARRFADATRRGERKFQPSNISLLPTQAKVSRSGLIKDLFALLGMMRHSTAT